MLNKQNLLLVMISPSVPLTKTGICFLGIILPRKHSVLEKVVTQEMDDTCSFLTASHIFPRTVPGTQDPGLHSSVGLSETLPVAIGVGQGRAAGVQAPAGALSSRPD